MKLSRLEPSPHIQGRYLLYLDNGTLLKVTDREVQLFSLYPGMELDEAQLAALARAGQESGAKNRAAKIISARPMSKKELMKRLTDKGEEASDAQTAADWLEELGAVNDEAYAEMIVRHYSARGYGQRRIQEELYRRGVPRELWEEALEQAPDSRAGIDAYLERKLNGQPPEPKALKRVADGLARRGYSWSEIQAGLRRYGAQIEE